MNNPELYYNCNAMSRVAAIEYLNAYTSAGKISWRELDNAIDLGCGDGSVTQIIKKYMPRNYTKFVACDVNENMLKFAENRDDDERTTYQILDAEGDLPFEMKGSFNHVFSFFTLHWIRNQEKAFKNIFGLLTEGGDCLLSFLGYTPIYHLFKQMGSSGKWSKSWLNDLNRFISPYYDMQDIESKLTEMLESIGFTDVEVKNDKKTYVLENGMELKNLIKAVEPYHMPKYVFDDFINDCAIVAKDIGLLEPTATGIDTYNKKINYTYNLIVIHAKKPQN